MRQKTILESLIDSLQKAASYNENAEEAPAVILWTDHDRVWEPLIGELQSRLPNLLLLGDWQPKKRQGPSYWVRCALARALPDVQWAADVPAIVYLPGVSRAELRQVNICPPELRPLAELQFRGAYWTQANGKDWTPFAFLTSSYLGGLSLDLAADNDTKSALKLALPEVFAERTVRFEGKRIDADEIRRLLNIDLDRDILLWMNDPAGKRATWDETHWGGLVHEANKRLKFNPDKEDVLTAAGMLAELSGEWANVWTRFKEAPKNFPGVKALLSRLQPKGLIGFDPEPYPSINAADEADLQASLLKFNNLSTDVQARAVITELESSHGGRRNWVWAALGESPIVEALAHLSRLATLTTQPMTSASPDAMRQEYEDTAWHVDAAMIDALACVNDDAGTRAVEAALTLLYKPWLETHAETFQSAVRLGQYPLSETRTEVATEKGLVVFFVDGLRYDAGRKLAAALLKSGMKVELGSAWTAVPSVTSSGKVLASPAAVFAIGEPDSLDFEPIHKVKRQALKADLLRKTLTDLGWQVLLAKGDVGDPTGCAWVETGDIDTFGHDNQLRLARDLSYQLDRVKERIEQLLAAGWKKIRVVTDHGWLLVPGKMDKVALDKNLTETKWGRAARLKPGVAPTLVTLPWTWCSEVQIALAPGAKSFKAGEHYAHGGLSLQESLTPILEIQSGTASVAKAAIKSAQWKGLRLRVEVEGVGNLTIDLRTKHSDATTSVTRPEGVEDGKAALTVEDDGLEGTSATLVVLDEAGNVLAKQALTIAD